MHKHVLCLTLFLLYGSVISENKQNTTKPLTILAYLQGFNPGQNLKIPAFVISPLIIIVSKANKKQSANDQPLSSDENFDKNSAIFKKVIPVQVILKPTRANEENDDIEVSFRQALNRGSLGKSGVTVNKTNETIQGSIPVDKHTKENAIQENTTAMLDLNNTIDHSRQNFTELATTEGNGQYPTAVYNDQVGNKITITDGPPNSFLLPPLLDEEWRNFTVTANVNITRENTTEAIEKSDNSTTSKSANETDSTIKGPYPAALYHNAEIDQVSITTNSNTNESPLPPSRDDRWTRFSSLGEMFSTSSEFRPLAGLYYDGFLHRPLPNRNPAFVPYNQYVVYQ